MSFINKKFYIVDYDNHNINIINYKNQSKHVFNNISIDFLDIYGK